MLSKHAPITTSSTYITAITATIATTTTTATSRNIRNDSCNNFRNSICKNRKNRNNSPHRNRSNLTKPPTLLQVRMLFVRHGESEGNVHPDLIGGRSSHLRLTAHGRAQGRVLGERLRHLIQGAATHNGNDTVAAEVSVYSSCSLRTIETVLCAVSCSEDTADLDETGILAALQRSPSCLTGVSSLLQEQSRGAWEGQPRAACYTDDVLAAMAADPWEYVAPVGPSPGGVAYESPRDVERRVAAFVTQYVLPKGHVTAREVAGLDAYDLGTSGHHTAIIFSHSMAIAHYLRQVTQCCPSTSWKLRLDNTSITEVMYDPREGATGGFAVVRVNDASHLDTM